MPLGVWRRPARIYISVLRAMTDCSWRGPPAIGARDLTQILVWEWASVREEKRMRRVNGGFMMVVVG